MTDRDERREGRPLAIGFHIGGRVPHGRQSLDCLPSSRREPAALDPPNGGSEGGEWKPEAETVAPDWGS